LANGQRSTITAVTVVPYQASNVATPSGTAGAAVSSTTAAPKLQTGAAAGGKRWLGWEFVGMVGGAVGVAMVL